MKNSLEFLEIEKLPLGTEIALFELTLGIEVSEDFKKSPMCKNKIVFKIRVNHYNISVTSSHTINELNILINFLNDGNEEIIKKHAKHLVKINKELKEIKKL